MLLITPSLPLQTPPTPLTNVTLNTAANNGSGQGPSVASLSNPSDTKPQTSSSAPTRSAIGGRRTGGKVSTRMKILGIKQRSLQLATNQMNLFYNSDHWEEHNVWSELWNELVRPKSFAA